MTTMDDVLSEDLISKIKYAAELLSGSKFTYVFTGAGISVESGIPPFRGPDGLWSKYDMAILDISFFRHSPKESWETIKEIFYDHWSNAKPNPAHYAVAELEKMGIVKAITTQNIDGLHQLAGSSPEIVYEYHGTLRYLRCNRCGKRVEFKPKLLNDLPPKCPDDNCGGVLRPDFVFFGEPIPEYASHKSITSAMKADVTLVIGTTGEIMPASMIPYMAKQNGSTIIEINPNRSKYTDTLTDVFLQGKAGIILPEIVKHVKILRKEK